MSSSFCYLQLLSLVFLVISFISISKSDSPVSPEIEEEDFEAQFDAIEEPPSKKKPTQSSQSPQSPPSPSPPPSASTPSPSSPSPQSKSPSRRQQLVEEDEEFEDFGEDDFFIPEPKKQQPKEVERRRKAPPQEHFYFEIFYILLLVSYSLNFYFGKNQNQRIALNWIVTFEDLLKKNFSKVGGGGVLLGQDSYNIYTLTAKGRVNCLGLQVTLELIKRQDLFARLFASVTGATDKMTIDVPLENMESFSFLLLRKKLEKSYQKEEYCDPVPHSTLPKAFTILSDCSDVVPEILTQEVLVTITGSESHLQAIHITDQSPFNQTHKKSLRTVLTIPGENQMESLDLLFKMSLFLIDLIPAISLPKQAKEKVQKRRQHLIKQAEKMTHQQRQEAAQERKYQKIQKEKEKVSTMSAEAQAKYQEKEQRKQMKKRQMKFKVFQ